MGKFIKRVFDFIKVNPSVLYSLILIILLPLALWWNTFFVVGSFQKNINLTLQTKALAIENILGEFLPEKIGPSNVLQGIIDKVSQDNPDIKILEIIAPKGDKFEILASQNKSKIGKEVSEPSLSLSWYQNQIIAHLVNINNERFWSLTKPIYDKNKKIALLSMSLSLKAADSLIAKTVQYSYLIVILVIIMVLILVLQHTRLFGYLKLYKELREVDKIRRSFFRMAIHELQSPIINIRGYVEALNEEIGASLSSSQKEDLKRVSLSAKSLSDLIYDILEVARIERGALDITLKQIFPQKIVGEITDFLQQKTGKKGLQLIYRQEKISSWAIKANPHRFREILQNLIENSIKYTKKGKIEIKERVDEIRKVYYLSVEDTGIGISGEEQARLFEKFYRVKNKETAGIPGTGLGLWIIKNLCRQMKGGITIESIKGVGSKFTVYFPAVKV